MECADPNIEFFRIVRRSYSTDELKGVHIKTNLAVRVAKIRGLIPWDYDGEREATMLDTSIDDVYRAGDDSGRGQFERDDYGT